jgi:hypothetical protein
MRSQPIGDSGSSRRERGPIRFLPDLGTPIVISLLIIIIGLGVATTILALTIPDQKRAQLTRFQKVADESFLRFSSALDYYKYSGLWLHQACRNRNMSFDEYRGVYQYISSTGLEFQGLACGYNVSSSERVAFENQSRTYLKAHYPEADYHGFIGYSTNLSTGDLQLGPMPNVSHYFVTHFVEPLENPYNQQAIDFDMFTSHYDSKIVLQSLKTGSLTVTERLRLLPPPKNASEPYEYSLTMAHPGLPLRVLADPDGRSDAHYHDVALLVIRFVALLQKAYQNMSVDDEMVLSVYDSTASVVAVKGQPAFLGGITLGPNPMSYNAEVSYTEFLDDFSQRMSKTLVLAERQWTMVAIAKCGTYEPDYFVTVFGALMIVVASLCAALWVYSRSRARAERVTLTLDNAKRAAQAERDLNDFIAHE